MLNFPSCLSSIILRLVPDQMIPRICSNVSGTWQREDEEKHQGFKVLGSGSVCFCSGSPGLSVWAGNALPTYRERAARDNYQYTPVIGSKRLIDPEKKQTDPLP